VKTAHSRRATARQAAVLLAAALAAGSARQVLLPGRIPWRQDWADYIPSQARAAGLRVVDGAAAAAAVRARSALVLDARPLRAYDRGRVPGALPLPADDRDRHLRALLPALEPGQPLLVYCSGRTCDDGLQVGRVLAKNGFTDVALYIGGYDDWRRRGGAVEGGRARP
jgi:rhodanese-related sulfurtransferase